MALFLGVWTIALAAGCGSSERKDDGAIAPATSTATGPASTPAPPATTTTTPAPATTTGPTPPATTTTPTPTLATAPSSTSKPPAQQSVRVPADFRLHGFRLRPAAITVPPFVAVA